MVDTISNALFEHVGREVNKANVSALTEYVCNRRAVLTVLRELQRKPAGDADTNNYYEEIIHNLFFPRFKTGDDVPHDYSGIDRALANLWLIDERLVFHKLLSSDVAPSQLR